MGRTSNKENKSVYQECREAAGYTRAQASELLEGINEKRLERMESGETQITPFDVVEFARLYKKPELCNLYCTNECAIGKKYVPEIKITGLAEIVLGIVSALNALNADRDKLVDMAVDGKITKEELPEFVRIRDKLDEMSLTIDSLKLWLEKMLEDGEA